MVTMLISMVILGGLVSNFINQDREYNYQNKRIDAVQDLEFAIRFISDDMRHALYGTTVQPLENAGFIGVAGTTNLTFWVWDPLATDGGCVVSATTKRAERKYVWDSATKSLRYDRMIDTNPSAGCGDNTGTAAGEILPNVTFFKVFRDDVDIASRTSIPFIDIPSEFPSGKVINSSGSAVNVPGYTILIEIEVPAGYKNGVFQDARGNVTTTKRVWRYAQVYPQSSAD